MAVAGICKVFRHPAVPLFLEYEAVLKRPEQLAAGQRSLAMVDAFLDALALRLDIVLAPAAFLQQLSQGEN
jgi:hypothetical protein